MQRAGKCADRSRERCAGVGAGGGDDTRGERRCVQTMLGRADPVRIDRFHVTRVGLASPAKEELLRRGLPACDDLVGNGVRLPVGEPGRPGDDRHHLRREPAEILAHLLVGDLVELSELPFAGKPRRLRLEVGRCIACQSDRFVRLRIRHLRVDVVVDEQAPHVLVGDLPDERLDVDTAVAERSALAVGLHDLGLDGDDAFEAWSEVVVAAHAVPPTRSPARATVPAQLRAPEPLRLRPGRRRRLTYTG